jgi:hypothetical protein
VQELLNIKADFLALEAAVQKALETPSLSTITDGFKAAGRMLLDVGGAADLILGGVFGSAGEAGGEAPAFDHQAELAEIAVCGSRIKAKVQRDPAAFGAIGDGTILKAFFDALPGLVAAAERILALWKK